MPHFRLSVTASFACAVVLASNVTAQAETKSFRDFLAACDNTRNCVVYGFPTAAYGAYVKIERGGAPDADAKATIAVEFMSANAFTLAFNDPDLNSALPPGPFNRASKDEETKQIVIDNPEAVRSLVRALQNAKSLRVTRQDPPGVDPSDPVESDISTNGALSALLWTDEQQKRIKTRDGFIPLRGGSIVVMPAPLPAPALPQIAAPAINTAALPTDLPKALNPKSTAKVRKLCGAKQDDAVFSAAARLDGNNVLYAYTCPSMSGAYNQAIKFLVASEDAPQNAREPRFILPPELSKEAKSALTMNATFDAKTATLTTRAKKRTAGDCGIDARWVWDGQAFRVLQYRSMPTCRGAQPDDWPTIYRAAVK